MPARQDESDEWMSMYLGVDNRTSYAFCCTSHAATLVSCIIRAAEPASPPGAGNTTPPPHLHAITETGRASPPHPTNLSYHFFSQRFKPELEQSTLTQKTPDII
ncbi:hypothetical protein VTL71DRAFT_5857 [Oculimacula yallundae]|uniref:Uncharacterized protein n=1 Tax=Oculimacula yallundae TaxID=86028 RepID=A0ABR4BYP8_9HELO